jgi:hypothetical protein
MSSRVLLQPLKPGGDSRRGFRIAIEIFNES